MIPEGPSATVSASGSASTASLLASVVGRQVLDLSQPLTAATPHSPNAPGFQMSLLRRHGDVELRGGGSFAADLFVTGGHTGTHVDALAHVSVDGKLHQGVDAYAAQRDGRFSSYGVDTMDPIVARAVVLDVTRVLGVDVVPAGFGIEPDHLEAAAEQAGVMPSRGDVALIRTGWGRHFGDPQTFVGAQHGAPGPTEAATRWLAAREIRATGAETIAYEQIRPGVGHSHLPAHYVLLVEHGINIMEVMNLDPLGERNVAEFLIIAAPLKIIGATGSPVRPLAIL
jgi:kynurenine formamidase